MGGWFSFVRSRKVVEIRPDDSMVSAESGSFTTPPWCHSQCQPWWPCPFQSRCLGVPAVAFCRCHSLQRLMNWLSGCCQCVCALGEGVPVTGGNPSYGSHPGATIVAILQGALGAGGPRRSTDPHTAVTPLETQRHSPRFGALIGSGKIKCVERSDSTGKLPDCARPLLMAAVRKGHNRKST